MGNLIYRQVFADQAAFRQLLGTQRLGASQTGGGDDAPGLSLDDIKRRIMVHERHSDFRRPDHFYKGYQDSRLGGVKSFVGLIGATLGGIGSHHLEWIRGRIAVKPEEFEHWQHGLPFFSPLAVAVYWLRKNIGVGSCSTVVQRRQELERSLLYTALLSPLLPATEDLIRRDGLNEMHMHLNGSTEVDLVWIDAVQRPELYRRELEKACSRNMVKELYDQIDLGLTVQEIHRRLAAARKMRWTITGILRGTPFLRDDYRIEWGGAGRKSVRLECESLDIVPASGVRMARHPVERLYSALDLEGASPLHLEALWLWRCFDALESLPEDAAEEVAIGLYLNFLALNLISRLTVQQINEFGFDQFQKYTLAGVREPLETHYEARFHQLGVSAGGDHDHLEGRFAPKDEVAKNADLFDSIVRGYLKHRGCGHAHSFHCLRKDVPECLDGGCTCEGSAPVRMKLGLVVHFIKETDAPLKGHRAYSNSCRYQKLRRDLDIRGRALLGLLRRSLAARRVINGFDGAANELHAPPEVFAPLFRRLRAARLPHASFHAGEDYRHLVSGIRAVVEAVMFLNLRNGDRVGHATALGIDPALWLEKIGPRLMLRKEDALDDAVFTHSVLSGIDGYAGTVLKLEKWIEELQVGIFRKAVPIQVMVAEWGIRQLDPRLAVKPEVVQVTGSGHSDFEKVEEVLEGEKLKTLDRGVRSEFDLLKEAFRRSPDAFRHFQFRQGDDVRRRGAELVEVKTDLYDLRALHALQMHAVRLLNERNVVIETLPTSNVRISFYDSYRQHHLFRWLGVASRPADLPDTARPTVCVGSDDTGIFSTSLRNEYAHINLTLINDFGLSADEAKEHLERLNGNGRACRFRDCMPLGGI